MPSMPWMTPLAAAMLGMITSFPAAIQGQVYNAPHAM